MTRRERTLIFNVCVGIFNIALGLLVEGTLIFCCMVLMKGLSPEAQQSVPVSAILPFILIVGLFAAIAISRVCIIWFLDTFGFRDKLDPNLSARYPKKQ